MKLTDYPQFDATLHHYIIAMAGGDGEDATSPILDYVNRDWQRVYDDALVEDALVLMMTPPEEWVDMLEVYDAGDDLVASWSSGIGWVTK